MGQTARCYNQWLSKHNRQKWWTYEADERSEVTEINQNLNQCYKFTYCWCCDWNRKVHQGKSSDSQALCMRLSGMKSVWDLRAEMKVLWEEREGRSRALKRRMKGICCWCHCSNDWTKYQTRLNANVHVHVLYRLVKAFMRKLQFLSSHLERFLLTCQQYRCSMWVNIFIDEV